MSDLLVKRHYEKGDDMRYVLCGTLWNERSARSVTCEVERITCIKCINILFNKLMNGVTI